MGVGDALPLRGVVLWGVASAAPGNAGDDVNPLQAETANTSPASAADAYRGMVIEVKVRFTDSPLDLLSKSRVSENADPANPIVALP